MHHVLNIVFMSAKIIKKFKKKVIIFHFLITDSESLSCQKHCHVQR